MELSPLARERLARIGEPSEEEKERLRHSQELSSLLSSYFIGKLSAESLWMRLKEYKDEGKESLIKDVQLRLADAVSLEADEQSIKRCREGILAAETLKDNNKYSILEAKLSSIESLCKQYKQGRDEAFNVIKSNIERQVEAAAQQIRQKTGRELAVDVKGSAELSVTSSPQWKQFIVKHEKEYQAKFQSYLAQLHANL
jgi:hypothetical protein